MLLDERFAFGKYLGLTLKEVYQGSVNIDTNLIISYIDYVLKNDDDLFNKDIPLRKIMSFEINPGLIKIKSFKSKKVQEHDWTERLQKIFHERNDHLNRTFLDSLDEFNIKEYKKDVKSPLITGCNPEYIAWCILNVRNFSIDDRTFKQLTSLDTHRFTGLNITYNTSDIYEYNVQIVTGKYSYPKKIVELNEEKNYLIGERENQRDFDQQRNDSNRRENDRNNFDARTDGQIGSYDDWYN